MTPDSTQPHLAADDRPTHHSGTDDRAALLPGTDDRAASHPGSDDDRASIAEIVRTFFAAFVSGPDSAARLDALRAVLLPQALIVRAGGEPAVYGVDTFIEPRRELLTGGRLTAFSEWEVSGRTDLLGDVAQHACDYAKSGVQDGTPFTGQGTKTFHFVRTPTGWRISAVAWSDT
jgi:hypothetical protein